MALWLLLLFVVTGLRCAAVPDDHPPAYRVAGELKRQQDSLAHHLADEVQWQRTVQDALPYRVVCLGPPALVTTLGPELELTTWAAGAECRAYPGMYPLVVQPPLAVLAALPTDDYTPPPGCWLLSPAGGVLWSSPGAVLLWPAQDEIEPQVAYFAVPAGGGEPVNDLLYPFGAQPRLVAVDTTGGGELWSTELAAQAPVADVQLWALSPAYGLLSLQYDYLWQEFACLERASGRLYGRRQLYGQPATRLVYPGGFDEPSAVRRDGDAVELDVFLADGTPERWRFELASGELSTSPTTPEPRPLREENELPVGGAGAPGPPAPPFPQLVLPTQYGDAWSIPALVDADGRVLVISAAGAQWLGADGAPRGSAGPRSAR